MLFWVAAAVIILFLVRFVAVARREHLEASLLREPLDVDPSVAADASYPAPRLVVDATAIAARSGTRPLGVSSPAAGVPAIAPRASARTERVVPLGALTASPVQQQHPSDRARRVASGGGGAAPQRQQLADRAPHAADESR